MKRIARQEAQTRAAKGMKKKEAPIKKAKRKEKKEMSRNCYFKELHTLLSCVDSVVCGETALVSKFHSTFFVCIKAQKSACCIQNNRKWEMSVSNECEDELANLILD